MADLWSDFEHGVPAYEKVVMVSATDAEGDAIGGFYVVPATDVNMPLSNDLLDDTDLTVTDARSHILGLREWNLDLTLNYKPGNDAYDIIRDGFTDRDTIWIIYMPNHDPDVAIDWTADGDEGYAGRAVVETFEHSGGVDDLETVDVSLQSASEIPFTDLNDIPGDSSEGA